MPSTEWLIAVLGALFLLILGGYGFTWAVYSVLRERLDTLVSNHLTHLEERVRELERRQS